MTSDDHSTRFYRMLQNAMTPPRPHHNPTILVQRSQSIPDLRHLLASVCFFLGFGLVTGGFI